MGPGKQKFPSLSVVVGNGWAVIEDIGGRDYMEDRFIAAEQIADGIMLFGVFDGHNGDDVADYARANVADHIRLELMDRSHRGHPDPVVHALEAAVDSLDRRGYADPALPSAKDVGCTACMAMLTSDNVWVVNVGDSRAIIHTGSGVMQMSLDHKPMLKSEADRVKKNGGFLSNTDGSWRINGRLNLSRSIGDWSMRPFVIASPTIKHHHRSHGKGCNEYLVLATDGLFDVMANEEIADIIDHYPHTERGVSTALKTLVRESRRRGSSDNITIVYVGMAVTDDRSSTRSSTRSVGMNGVDRHQ